MRIVDANVLLYAVNEDATHHGAARRWVLGALNGSDRVGFAWVALLAFVRIATSPTVFASPLSPEEAFAQVRNWVAAPGAVVVEPRRGHLDEVERMLGRTGTGGNLVNDAHLAALAVQHRADVVSYDNDFTRFEGVRWFQPDDLLEGGRR